MTEVGFCLVSLTGSRLGENKQDKIRRILGFSNSAELRADIENRFGRADSILHIANGLYGLAQYDIALAKSALRQYADKVEAGQRPRAKFGEGSVQAASSHPTHGGFGQDKNLADLGCLFRVASAVNSNDARRLVSLINPKAMAQTAAEELNLGRLTVFILGLQQTSRRYTLIVVAGICSEEQWRKQYEENEELENLIHYARSLSRLDSKKSAEFVRFLFQNYGSEIAESLKVQASILMISNWVRVLARIEGEHLEQYGKSLADTLQRAAKDETRLWHLLEAAESLIEIKALQEAKNLCKYILDETQPMASVRNLRNWLTIINKTLYIERTLELNNFTAELTRSMHDLQLPIMVASEGQVILSAFTYQLFSINPTSSLTRLRAIILGYQRAIIEAANEDSDSTVKIISLILAQAPADTIAAVVKSIDWLQTSAWELGLAALLFDAICADDGQSFPLSLDTQSPEFNKFLLNGLNEHSTNLEFALTLYLTRRLNLDIQMSAVSQTEIAERLEGESSSATRWLLRHYENPKTLKGLPYFIWYYLKETVLRPTYLPWTNNIEQITDNVAFRQPYRMDLSDLSSS